MSSADKYFCGACPDPFRNKDERKNHRARYHPERNGRYKASEGRCVLCRKTYPDFFSFFDHLTRVTHGQEFFGFIRHARARLGNEIEKTSAQLFFKFFIPLDETCDFKDKKNQFALLDEAIDRVLTERQGRATKIMAAVEKGRELHQGGQRSNSAMRDGARMKQKEGGGENQKEKALHHGVQQNDYGVRMKNKDRGIDHQKEMEKEKEERKRKAERERQEQLRRAAMQESVSPADDENDSDIEIIDVIEASERGIRKAERMKKKAEVNGEVKEEPKDADEMEMAEAQEKRKETPQRDLKSQVRDVRDDARSERRASSVRSPSRIGEKAHRAGEGDSAAGRSPSMRTHVGEKDKRPGVEKTAATAARPAHTASHTTVGEKAKRADEQSSVTTAARAAGQSSSTGRVSELGARLKLNNTLEKQMESIRGSSSSHSSLKRRNDEDAPPRKRRVSFNLDLDDDSRQARNDQIPAPVSPTEATAAASAGQEPAAAPVGSHGTTQQPPADPAARAKYFELRRSFLETQQKMHEYEKLIGIGSPLYDDGAADGAAAAGPNLEVLVAQQMADEAAAAAAAAAAMPPLPMDAEPCQRDKDYWNCKGHAVRCPRGCPPLKGKDNKLNRRAHYTRCHYDIYFFLVQSRQSSLSEHLLLRYGEKKEGLRVCLHCTDNRRHHPEHDKRSDLLRHIQKEHIEVFWELVEQYKKEDQKSQCEGDSTLHALLTARRHQ